MTQFETAEQVINALLKNLRAQLSPSDNVTTAYASASIKGLTRDSLPDLVIQHKNDTFIVEVKHFSRPAVLPLSAALATKRLVEANLDLSPKVIFATNSTINSMLRTELAQQHVNVVEYKTSAELLDKVLTSIQRRDQSR